MQGLAELHHRPSLAVAEQFYRRMLIVQLPRRDIIDALSMTPWDFIVVLAVTASSAAAEDAAAQEDKEQTAQHDDNDSDCRQEEIGT